MATKKINMKKFTLKYKKGSLSGVQVIKANSFQEATDLLEAELKANHTKLPATATKFSMVESQQVRVSAKEMQRHVKFSPADAANDFNKIN